MMRFTTLLLLVLISYVALSQNVVLVIIDGARYSETFGDPNRIHIPEMSKLAEEGSIVSNFYNQGTTYTSKAIPAIWCGTWTNTIDTIYNGASTQYTEQPSIFEYFREQKDMPAEMCQYFIKYVPSLWLPSFHNNYGPDYWPLTICEGQSDNDVLENAIGALTENHPQLSVVYFADVDHYGHSGIWTDYTGAIKNADKAVGEIWEFLQTDEVYKDNTILMVTNDHGRHDNQNGGFKGHGCSCNGCRQIMFLAIGPGIKQNYISETEYKLTDVAVTIASELDIDATYATGEVISDVFGVTRIKNALDEELFYIAGNQLIFKKENTGSLEINILDVNGKIMNSLKVFNPTAGNVLDWNNGNLRNGIYLVSVNTGTQIRVEKAIVNSN